MRAVLPLNLSLADESQIRLMYQGRRLQGVTRALFAQVACGLPVQLGVDDWKQPI